MNYFFSHHWALQFFQKFVLAGVLKTFLKKQIQNSMQL